MLGGVLDTGIQQGPSSHEVYILGGKSDHKQGNSVSTMLGAMKKNKAGS